MRAKELAFVRTKLIFAIYLMKATRTRDLHNNCIQETLENATMQAMRFIKQFAHLKVSQLFRNFLLRLFNESA